MSTPRSYEEMAARFGYRLDQFGWTERRVTKPGMRNFLKLIAARVLGHDDATPRWQALYEQSRWAQDAALREFHTRLPKRYSMNDRARVKYLIARAWIPPDQLHQVKRWTEGD